jgi:hypothetical protein
MKHGLLCLRDTFSGEEFLIGMGVEVLVVPLRVHKGPFTACAPNLYTINRSKIRALGCLKLGLCLDDNKYWQQFVVADVDKCILGANFLHANKLLVDIFNGSFVWSGTWAMIGGSWTKAPGSGIHTVKVPDVFQVLLQEFPAIHLANYSCQQ